MLTFLDLENPDIHDSSVRTVILPVPFESSVCYGQGTSDGPLSILEASGQVELFDTLFQTRLPDNFIYTHSVIGRTKDYSLMARELRPVVANMLEIGKFPVIIGGEHSIAVPAIQAFSEKYPGATVIHFDAHADLRDTYQDNRNSHACTLRRIRELGLKTLSVGIRSMSLPEYTLSQTDGISLLSPESPDFWTDWEKALSRLSGPAWLTFDVDGMDPGIMPSTGTPEPGGFTWKQTMRILSDLSQSSLAFKGMDFVEFSPVENMHSPQFTAAKLLHRMIFFLVKGCR